MTNIKKRHFCKSVALMSLIPLFKMNILSANTSAQNQILTGSFLIDGKEASSNFQDLNKTVLEIKLESVSQLPILLSMVIRSLILRIKFLLK